MKEAIKFFVLVSILVFSLGVVNGSLVEESKTSGMEVYPGEEIEYNVTLLNTGDSAEYVSMLLLPPFGSLNELNPNNFYLDPGERQNVQITIHVRSDVQPGNRAFFINFYNENGSKRDDTEVLLRTNIKAKEKEAPDYSNIQISNVRTEPSEIDPREDFSIKFESQNPYDSIQVPLAISYGEEEVVSSVEIPHGNKTLTISDISVSDDKLARSYEANLVFDFTKREVVSKDFTLDISGYTSCGMNESESSNLISKEWSARIENTGNDKGSCVVGSDLSGLESYFISSRSEGSNFEKGRIEWNLTLSPGSTKEVSYTVSYLPLILLPFAAVFLGVGVWLLVRKMDVKKEMVDAKVESGKMTLKVEINLRNRTSSTLSDVKVMEPLPSFMKDIEGFGTISGQVENIEGQKYMVWNINDLSPKEERVLSYEMESSVEVLGKIKLDPTKVRFVTSKGVEKEAKSGVLRVVVEE